MANISAIKLPSGTTYDIKDSISGYTTNTGTITQVKTTAGAHTTIDVSSGAATFNVPTKTSHLTNDSGFVTTQVFYGTCETAAATAAKVVTCTDFTSSDLKAGVIIVVNFSATNSAAVADLTLNINGTGAKKIQYINNGTRGNLSSAGYIKASTSYPFIYDGTYWLAQLNYNSNTTYSAMAEAEMETGTATTARTITAARLKEAILYHTENNKDKFEFEIVLDGLGQPCGLADGVTVADIQAAIEAGKEVILIDGNGYKCKYVPDAGYITDSAVGYTEYLWFEYFYNNFYRTDESPDTNYDAPHVLIYGVNTNQEAESYDQIYYEIVDLVTYNQFNTNATYGTFGLVKPAYSTTGTASFSTTPQAYTNNPSIAARTTTSNRYYGVEVDSNGRLFVNVPWAADTNTTYALSGALSSHKFTSTLTAGGSGSGTSTSDFTLAAGTGITITDDASARKMTIACSVTNTDEKVKAAALTSGTLYYPILATGTGTATRQIDSTLNGLTYKSTAGTASIIGTAKLTIGNSIASGRPDNEQGQIILYGSTAYAHTIVGEPTIDRTITLPNASGTLALNTVVTAGSSVSSGGLMSQADKTKLDSIASDAAAIQIIRWTESS